MSETRASTHRGGIIWTPHPPKPSSPHRRGRGAKWGLLLELGTLAAESWHDRATADDEGEPIGMLLALTRWYCSIELPTNPAAIVNGPPLFERRLVRA